MRRGLLRLARNASASAKRSTRRGSTLRAGNAAAWWLLKKAYALDEVRPVHDIAVDPRVAHEHAPTVDCLELAWLLLRLGTRGRVIADLGCGPGGAIAVFRMLPFRKIYGIELSAELAAKAAANFRRDPRIEILHGDARALVPPELDIAYLFNPFPEAVLVEVLERLGAERTRDLDILFRYPNFVFARVAPRFPNLVGLREFSASDGTPYATCRLSPRRVAG
jgi:SAM-dependent methyltransferase